MKKLLKILPLLFILLNSGCLNDSDVITVNYVLEDNAKILRYLESIGDFPNTDAAPALITATDLLNKIDQYFILDIRSSQEFFDGHIVGAINIPLTNLYETVDSLNKFISAKNIVIVSKNGQASAYFTCLLRLTGFSNIYTLNYGMASWNRYFADEWLNAIGNSDYNFENTFYPKRPFTSLPELVFPLSLSSEKEKIIYRAKELIRKGFVEEINYYTFLSNNIMDTHFIVCYGKGQLYESPRDLGPKGHPPNAVWFKDSPLFEFRSTNSLQTLPNDQPILIYSGDGQLGAFMSAYLTLLGYDVKTLLFGANQLIYFRLMAISELNEYVFSNGDIMNYPYSQGN